MKFLDSFKNIFKPEQIEHEAIDLKTGKSITLVKVRQPDGSYVIKRVSDAEAPAKTLTIDVPKSERPKASRFKVELPKITLPKRKEKEEAPVKKEVTVKDAAKPTEREKIDLIDLLETDIDRAIKIKEERDMLADKLKEFEERLEEFDEHKSARMHAETKVTEYEDSIVKLKEEKVDLEKSIVELKEERDSIKDKINYYEEVLIKIKDKIVQFDEKIA